MGDFHVACFAGVCGQMRLKLSEAVNLPLSHQRAWTCLSVDAGRFFLGNICI